jgi:iron complex transport system ATP-binding protein
MELRSEKLAFGYRRQAVGRDVDVRVRPREVLCLLGPNGSGKTTLFKTLLGLLPAQGGRIFLDGEDMSALSRGEIARKIAYVPQAHDAVFPYSVSDMVLMGRTVHRGLFSAPGREDRIKVEAALSGLGIAGLSDRDYTRISGGQRQLALIARALAQQTELMVMDEPTASLDFGNQVLVLEQLKRLAATGLGIVFSTHNPDHAFACATHVLVLDDGLTRAAGEPVEVLTEDLLSSVYGVEVRLETLQNGHRVCVPPALLG